MSLKDPVWLEVALNGPWGRQRQPGIPIRVDDIIAQGIACAKAGAAIVHVHAYDEITGLQNDDWKTYATIITAIQAETDAIVYPSIPLVGDSGGNSMDPNTRFAALSKLADAKLLEWAVVDPGSVNLERYAAIERGEGGFIYSNTYEDVQEGLSLAAAKHFHPSYAIYEPGFLRLGAAMAKQQQGMPKPLYRFMFSDEFTFGFPPKPYALDTYLTLLEEEASDCPWMVAGLGVAIDPLVSMAIERGGGLRVGLEDAPFGTHQTNLECVENMVEKILASGRTPALPAQIREQFDQDV